MVGKTQGSIFRRTYGRYFSHIPTDSAEDTGFPLAASTFPVKIIFKPEVKKLIIGNPEGT